jgi:hypothetical protein
MQILKKDQDEMAPLCIACIYIVMMEDSLLCAYAWEMGYCVLSGEMYVFHVVYQWTLFIAVSNSSMKNLKFKMLRN